MNVKKLVRNCVKNFKPYIPGKSIESLKRELGLKKIIKLASNENPLGPSPHAVRAIRQSASRVFLYPDGCGLSLRRAIAKKNNLSASQVMLGSGTDEIIEIIGKTFFKPGDNIVVSKHAFIRYKMAGELMNIRVKEIPMKNFTHDLRRMAEAVDKKTKAVFIANPNNPTGTYVSHQETVVFLKQIPRNVLVVLDEAYFDYASLMQDYPDGIRLFKSGYKNIIVLRTFSKIYGLAGLRVGFCAGSESVIDVLDRVRPPFNMTRVSMDAAEASLKDRSIVRKSQRLVADGRNKLYRELSELGCTYIPSAGNFVMIKVPGGGIVLFKRFLKKGIIIRAMDEYDLPDFIRVTIGTPDEMNMFINALKKLLSS